MRHRHFWFSSDLGRYEARTCVVAGCLMRQIRLKTAKKWDTVKDQRAIRAFRVK